jgi:hypothetical protein
MTNKTQPVNSLWTEINYENVEIRVSQPKLPTPKASLKMIGQSPTNPAKSMQNYPAPVQQIHITTMLPAKYYESNTLSPDYQKKLNVAESKIALPLPVVNQGGAYRTYEQRLENRIIYDPKFNWTGVASIPVILLSLILLSTILVKRR